MERINFVEREKDLGAEIDLLTAESPEQAMLFAQSLALNSLQNDLSRAESAACARLICRFLLHRKNKSRLVDCIRESQAIRKAVFGRLNTYKYSLIYLLKRILKENDCGLTAEVTALLQSNPYGDASAKPYSSVWSAAGVVEGALKVPAGYLSAGEDAARLAQRAVNNNDSLQ